MFYLFAKIIINLSTIVEKLNLTINNILNTYALSRAREHTHLRHIQYDIHSRGAHTHTFDTHTHICMYSRYMYMNTYVCVYVCVYACHVWVLVCMSTYRYIHIIWVPIYCTHMRINVYVYACMYVVMYACVHVCMCMCICVYVCIYISMCVYW